MTINQIYCAEYSSINRCGWCRERDDRLVPGDEAGMAAEICCFAALGCGLALGCDLAFAAALGSAAADAALASACAFVFGSAVALGLV